MNKRKEKLTAARRAHLERIRKTGSSLTEKQIAFYASRRGTKVSEQQIAANLEAKRRKAQERLKTTGCASTPGQRRAAAKARAAVSSANRKRQFEASRTKGQQTIAAKMRGKPASPQLRERGLNGSAAAKKYFRRRASPRNSSKPACWQNSPPQEKCSHEHHAVPTTGRHRC